MGQNTEPFTPASQGTVNLAVTGTTGRVVLAKTGSPQTVMVTSAPGGNIAFIEFGDVTVVSVAATGTPILPGAIMVFAVGAGITNVAAIGSATTTLYFTSGHGA